VNRRVIVIGGGLAGVEAAYQVAKRDIDVDIYEMRPEIMTEAHATGFLGELVCSNSLGSNELTSASGLLKQELKMADSFFLKQAVAHKVPAGNSLSVDRMRLAEDITREIASFPRIRLIRQEIREIPERTGPVIIASGPLTSAPLADAIIGFTMRKNLFFFDATSPLVRAETIDFGKMFKASRYDKGDADFFNIPLDEDQYRSLVGHMTRAETSELKEFEKNILFEACLPIEEIARRGEKSLAFGPLKPVGLIDPSTRRMPFAVVQLRPDDVRGNLFQLVGFQTRLKWGEQKRIFRMLPGMENAEFERFGRMHRNTYINSPLILNEYFQSKADDRIFFSGQISGVEGYVESVGSGLFSGISAARMVLGQPPVRLPEASASGSLARYIASSDWREFRPTKFTFGLLPDDGSEMKNKKRKKELKAEKAMESMTKWIQETGI
jgi:methylenetetrahydrofolate--tRNA-(uracil-5-)-methyltransferase